MITASHQTFSRQNKHLSGQIKFGQTNSLYVVNGNFIEFAKNNKCQDNFRSLPYALSKSANSTIYHTSLGFIDLICASFVQHKAM